jgi:hypothetical protein
MRHIDDTLLTVAYGILPQTPTQNINATAYYPIPLYSPPNSPWIGSPLTRSPQVNAEKRGEKRQWRTVQAKVEVLNLLYSFSWTLGDLLWYLFAMRDMKGKEFEPSSRHFQVVSKFLTGETKVSVIKILELWIKSPYSLPPERNEERQMLYSTKIDYHEMKYAWPAITSFAIQIVEEELISEAKKAARHDGGLHTFTSSKGKVSRYDLGEQTFLEAMEILEKKMPIMWQYLLKLSVPSEESVERNRRPPEYVGTH